MAQAPRPRSNTKTAPKKKVSTPRSQEKTSKPSNKKVPVNKKAPSPSFDLLKLLPKIRMSSIVRVLVLLAIVTGLFVFNPGSGIITPHPSDSSNSTQTYKVDIRNRTLADPHQGGLKLKVGSRSILDVTTDQDGRLDLVSSERDVFNPLFSNISNTLSIPTDRAESFRLEFHPESVDSSQSQAVVIGTVIFQN